MKFEKIDDNILKITYTKTDLKAQNIDYDKLLSGSEDAQNIIMSLVENAQKKFGFDMGSHQMVIEAKSMPNHTFEVTITAIDEFLNDDKTTNKRRLKLNTQKKEDIKKTCSDHIIIRFDAFESCLAFARAIHNKFNIDSKLYKEASNYYIDLKDNCEDDSSENILNLLTLSGDFGTYVSNPDIFESYLNEHAKLIIKNTAIEKLFKAFQ